MSLPPRHETLDAGTARWLVSDEGRGAIDSAASELRHGRELLDVVTALRSRGFPSERTSAAVGAARARLKAPERPADAALVFTLAGLEQASHPRVAAWRSRRFARDEPVWDLCCGEGGDALALAASVPLLVALDRDRARLLLARHNVGVRGLPAAFVVGDARRAPCGPRSVVHVDPGRRGVAGRARRLAEYDPPVAAITTTLERARGAGLVLSPAVELADPDLPADAELEFVQVGTRLVEAVAWTGDLARHATGATATILAERDTDGKNEHVRHRDADVRMPVLPVRTAGEWLVEPAAAAVRARLHEAIGAELDAWRVATRRALLSTDHEPDPSPWWRAWRVEASLPAQARHVRDWLRRHGGDAPISFSTHGIDIDVNVFWNGLGRPPRGPRGRRVHLVRLDDGARAYVCRSQTHDADGLHD